jgi:pimeloyl-ACP methyl ester carboxylesterase
MNTLSVPLAPKLNIKSIQVDGVKLFYREAGEKNKTTLLLLHGFPSSSHMYRDLMPMLAGEFRVIAPDLPGFGFTEVPADAAYEYTFDRLGKTVNAFTDALGLETYAMYVFDYGAPVGFRLAISKPERITAIISQNGNAYEEGLSQAWDPIQAYWRNNSEVNRGALRSFLTYETTKWQYTYGTNNPELVAPESYTLDAALMQRIGNQDIQLDLFRDYASNVELYPRFQQYLRENKPPTLVVWGKNDPFFLPIGAEAFKKDNPASEVHLLDTGHFAVETHLTEITTLVRDFLFNRVVQPLSKE